MLIRVMTANDYDKVYKLWMSCKNMGFNDLDDSRDGVRKFLERNPNTSFVAEENEEIVGVVLVGHDGRRGYIYHLSVADTHRRRGIGAKLVQSSIGALKAEGINKAALLVFKHNDVGNAFWEKQGFTMRTDVAYRNREITKMIRYDT